jgi:hypothetical protein
MRCAVPVPSPALSAVEGACPEPVEGACPEPVEGACPEPVEGACPACPEHGRGELVEGRALFSSVAACKCSWQLFRTYPFARREPRPAPFPGPPYAGDLLPTPGTLAIGCDVAVEQPEEPSPGQYCTTIWTKGVLARVPGDVADVDVAQPGPLADLAGAFERRHGGGRGGEAVGRMVAAEAPVLTPGPRMTPGAAVARLTGWALSIKIPPNTCRPAHRNPLIVRPRFGKEVYRSPVSSTYMDCCRLDYISIRK